VHELSSEVSFIPDVAVRQSTRVAGRHGPELAAETIVRELRPCACVLLEDEMTKTAKKSPAGAKKAAKRSSAKRELIKPGTDARYIKRAASGRFKESDDVGRSQKVDRAKKAKKKVASGFGDQGDRLKKR
jgi:hypothetical protein